MISTYPPQQCGIGTFSQFLTNALEDLGCKIDIFALQRTETVSSHFQYPSRVKYVIDVKNRRHFMFAGDFINKSNLYQFAILQHEFDLFPVEGIEVELAKRVTSIPLYTIVHNAHSFPLHMQLQTIRALAAHSVRLLVMSKRSFDSYKVAYGIHNLETIHHGLLDVQLNTTMDSSSTAMYKQRIGVDHHEFLLLTFGILHERKGIKYLIEAMPSILGRYRNTTLMIVGQAKHQQAHLQSLKQLAKALNVEAKVQFLTDFITDQRILDFLLATDVYVIPYLDYTPVSGTLTYAMAAARSIVSTEFVYAKEMLSEKRGYLVKVGDSVAMSRAIRALLSQPELRAEMASRAYQFTRNMTWDRVAGQILSILYRDADEQMRERYPEFFSRILKPLIGEYGEHKTDTSISWGQYKTQRTCGIQGSMIWGCDGRRIELNIPLTQQNNWFSSKESPFFNLLSDSYLQIHGQFTMDTSNVMRNVLIQVGFMWEDYRLLVEWDSVKLLQGNNEELPLSHFSSECISIEASLDLLSEAQVVMRFVLKNRYKITVYRSVVEPWLDVRLDGMTDIVSPHGIIAQVSNVRFFAHNTA